MLVGSSSCISHPSARLQGSQLVCIVTRMSAKRRTHSTLLGRPRGACAQQAKVSSCHPAGQDSHGSGGRWPDLTAHTISSNRIGCHGILRDASIQSSMPTEYTSALKSYSACLPACERASSTSGAANSTAKYWDRQWGPDKCHHYAAGFQCWCIGNLLCGKDSGWAAANSHRFHNSRSFSLWKSDLVLSECSVLDRSKWCTWDPTSRFCAQGGAVGQTVMRGARCEAQGARRARWMDLEPNS